MSSIVRLACVLLVAARPAVAPAARGPLAQSQGITGVVRDPQQAVVPGAQVILTDARTTATTRTVTDGQGRYSFAPLEPDRYVVEVRARGFQVATSVEIALAAGESATRDFVLALAGATESVTVTAPAGVDRAYH